MSEGRLYVAGGAVAFVGLSVLVIVGSSWFAALLLIGGLAAVAVAAWKTRRRTRTVRVEIEDDHLHPIPVLDAPKGTFDLIAGLTVRLHNRHGEPIGVRADTLLYRRTAWKWDQPVPGSEPVALLAPSVVPARTAKSFFVKNYTRLPDEVDELTPSHFVKLIVDVEGFGKSAQPVFLRERFVLPKEKEAVGPPRGAWDEAPLLPFKGLQGARSAGRSARSAAVRFKSLVGGLVPGGSKEEIRIHRLRESDDSLEGLIDEIEAELGEDGRDQSRV